MAPRALDEEDEDFFIELYEDDRSFLQSKYVKILIVVSIATMATFLYFFLKLIGTSNEPLPLLKKYDTLPYLQPIHNPLGNTTDDGTIMTLHEYNDEYTALKSDKKRLLMIGDVHGEFHSLQKLLRKMKFDPKNDQVVLLGDFITKGTDSMKVLNYAMENGFKGVLGNHELSLLVQYSKLKRLGNQVRFEDDEMFPAEFSVESNAKEERRLARMLKADHVRFLTSLPAVLQVGPVPATDKKRYGKPYNGLAVHAGMLWSKNVEKQSIYEVTTMRNLLPPDFKTTSEERGVKHSVAWYHPWSKQQKKLNRDERQVVYYGHDAGRGLNLKEFSKGLDSGCVYGRELSGVAIWSEIVHDQVIFREKLYQVNCQ